MLSFDITDRNIRIIKGTESGNKIRISSAATLELDEDIIVNGYVQDIPRVATLINSVLATNKMADKEAIVSISSNLTIFKELQLAIYFCNISRSLSLHNTLSQRYAVS